ncbi:MAG: AIR synthase related protein [FCB group bacterium]|jgi:thiamine-monophosphate kinase
MDAENQIIKTILGNFKSDSRHLNEFFHSDSEIIRLGNKDYLLTVDNYSDEDHFRTNNPYVLGRNLAVSTLSDIFACGGKPLFFANSLTKADGWDIEYINEFSKGISDVLKDCDAAFIGGDLGSSQNWNFTGVAIGESDRIVTRKGASQGDLIYLTGPIGNGNFESASQLTKLGQGLENLFENNIIQFPLRLKESELVSKYASSCIDTSDGLFKSLNIVSEINDTGFLISDIPYSEQGLMLTNSLHLPEEILMFGESGEYELLFTITPEQENSLLTDSRKFEIQLFKIGSISYNKQKLLQKSKEIINFNDFEIYARSFKNHYDYIGQLTQYLFSKFQKM